MLTRQEAISDFDFSRGRIIPDRLTRAAHAHYLPVVEKMLTLYREGMGLTRAQLHRQAAALFDEIPDCPARRIAALVKLLDDVSEFESDRGRRAAKLRRRVFRSAACRHPLVSSAEGVFGNEQWLVKHQIAAELKMSWSEVERHLFADVMEFHPLKSFDGYANAAELLARYNVAQVQACLYRAVRMTVWAKADLKIIVRAIKLSRLMHSIERKSNGEFQFTLDGAASAVRSTRRYGVAMARLIPVLLACRDWRMQAQIEINGGHRLSLEVSSKDGLTSSKTLEGLSSDFDSEVEADLMEKWNGSPVAGWKLDRESEILHRNQKVFLPDFVATHDSGRKVYVEVVGYWTPEYLQAKGETLALFADCPILVVAQLNKQEQFEPLLSGCGLVWLWYKTKVTLKSFADALDSFLS